MPGPSLGYSLLTGPEWSRVVAALTRADAELPGEFRKSIKDQAEKLADVAKNRVRGLPTPAHAGHTGLRARVAEGVRVIDRGEGGVRVTTTMPKPSEGRIPRGLDSPKGWRHPLFGDKSQWFKNPGYDWFLSTFQHSSGQFKDGLEKVIDKALKDVADAGGVEN